MYERGVRDSERFLVRTGLALCVAPNRVAELKCSCDADKGSRVLKTDQIPFEYEWRSLTVFLDVISVAVGIPQTILLRTPGSLLNLCTCFCTLPSTTGYSKCVGVGWPIHGVLLC